MNYQIILHCFYILGWPFGFVDDGREGAGQHLRDGGRARQADQRDKGGQHKIINVFLIFQFEDISETFNFNNFKFEI